MNEKAGFYCKFLAQYSDFWKWNDLQIKALFICLEIFFMKMFYRFFGDCLDSGILFPKNIFRAFVYFLKNILQIF